MSTCFLLLFLRIKNFINFESVGIVLQFTYGTKTQLNPPGSPQIKLKLNSTLAISDCRLCYLNPLFINKLPYCLCTLMTKFHSDKILTSAPTCKCSPNTPTKICYSIHINWMKSVCFSLSTAPLPLTKKKISIFCVSFSRSSQPVAEYVQIAQLHVKLEWEMWARCQYRTYGKRWILVDSTTTSVWYAGNGVSSV